MFKPDTNLYLSGYKNTNLQTELFIDIKRDTERCFS